MKKTIEEQWSLTHGKHNGKPIIVRFNEGARQASEKKGPCSYRLGIAIPLLHPEENGLPIKEEGEILLGIEDELLQFLDSQSIGILCAIITTAGMREFLLYLNKPEDGEKIVKYLENIFTNYRFQYYTSKDNEWSAYDQLKSIHPNS